MMSEQGRGRQAVSKRPAGRPLLVQIQPRPAAGPPVQAASRPPWAVQQPGEGKPQGRAGSAASEAGRWGAGALSAPFGRGKHDASTSPTGERARGAFSRRVWQARKQERAEGRVFPLFPLSELRVGTTYTLGKPRRYWLPVACSHCSHRFEAQRGKRFDAKRQKAHEKQCFKS
jgi:hypothetical protein